MKLVACVFVSLAISAPCAAQVVQLPAVGSFGVSTTVSVPDQGTASLGGTNRASYGSTTRGFGPLASTARGGQLGASSASVSVTVIDLAAMDEALLNTPTNAPADKTTRIAPNHTAPKPGKKIVNTLTPHHYDRITTRPEAPPLPFDWMRALGPQGNDYADSAESKVRDGSNIRYFMEKAAEAQALGRVAAAKTYYHMALERMTPAQRERFDEVVASRQAKPGDKSKNATNAAKKPEPGTVAPGAGATSGSTSGSVFDDPAAGAGPNTDMNSSPF